ncbi:MAG: hypothetical protein SFX72_21625 [Isosphaeraceae bacterium]|nr:hypothetical protein [Isosphaeraceae bacterium]
MSQPYASYDQVPWFRRADILGAITFLGLILNPAILFSCIVVLTGDVYYDQVDDHGQLKRWSVGNKVAAVVLLIIQSALTILILYRVFSASPR